MIIDLPPETDRQASLRTLLESHGITIQQTSNPNTWDISFPAGTIAKPELRITESRYSYTLPDGFYLEAQESRRTLTWCLWLTEVL